MYRLLFKKIKNLVPRISDTELIALRSGTTSIDREIFMGKVKYPDVYLKPKKFSSEKITNLLDKFGDSNNVYPNGNFKKIFEELGKDKFFSFIIDEKYGGTHLSVTELSSVLTKIASVNPALGVSVMVPNSLGPGELLQNYGTEQQKNQYLPGLADGTYIPCFGLTGPNNGSDATGSIDTGTVIINQLKEKCINLNINKRYITLGPIANLIGLAFNLKDPNNLLESGKEGTTVVLIENDHPGLKQLTHHNPLDVGFPNGTLKGELQIPLDNIIGGEKNAGHGWKMLMECLAAGRGICLPATANACSKVSTLGVLQYSKHRKQFKLPLIEMEGVQDKLVEMIYNTWLIQTSVGLTNTLLDSGEKPAVISAIMKQQTTDRAREVLNCGMDIHAGGAICLGKNNFLEKFYKSAPIGITVEGSNVLTRNLIIFGQGLNKSHPYIYPILNSIIEDNLDEFKINFKKIINHSLKMYLNSITAFSVPDILDKQTIHFANLSNFIALNGGSLKSKQRLSGDMADILSNLYLAHSVRWYENQYGISKKLTKYCINRLCNENQIIINRIIDNSGYLKTFLFYMKKGNPSFNYNDKKELIEEILFNKDISNELKKDIITENTALEPLLQLCKKNTIEDYEKLYNDVIQVGEYNNPEVNN